MLNTSTHLHQEKADAIGLQRSAELNVTELGVELRQASQLAVLRQYPPFNAFLLVLLGQKVLDAVAKMKRQMIKVNLVKHIRGWSL